jgi:hypothetical protein
MANSRNSFSIPISLDWTGGQRNAADRSRFQLTIPGMICRPARTTSIDQPGYDQWINPGMIK